MHPKSILFGSPTRLDCDWCGAEFIRGASDRYRLQATFFCSPSCQHAAERVRWSGPALSARFWAKVDRSDFCWIRQGTGRGTMGYRFIVIAGHRVPNHRFAWEDRSGAPVPNGFKVCHTCDVPACVRNDDRGFYEVNGIARPRFGHLWLGTHDDNMADMKAKGRSTTGDRNGSRLHPERMSRGDRHRSRTSPQTLPRGEAHYIAKLTEADVREIRIRRTAGEPYKTIASDKGVTAALCCMIALRQIWKHVE